MGKQYRGLRRPLASRQGTWTRNAGSLSLGLLTQRTANLLLDLGFKLKFLDFIAIPFVFPLNQNICYRWRSTGRWEHLRLWSLVHCRNGASRAGWDAEVPTCRWLPLRRTMERRQAASWRRLRGGSLKVPPGGIMLILNFLGRARSS